MWELSLEGFPSYGIWSVKDAPFVCLEPWMGRCDNIGFDKEISEKPGINKVESGETFEKEYQIVVAIVRMSGILRIVSLSERKSPR